MVAPSDRQDPPAVPTAEAVEQKDGSFIQDLADGSTLRWTKRPDGSWRRPEHRRAGWIGELERPRYTVAALRDGQGGSTARTLEAMVAEQAAPKAALQAGPVGKSTSSSSGPRKDAGPPAAKHELQRPWCLWVGPNEVSGGVVWSDGHSCAHEFYTVEDFWCVCHHANPPSRLQNADYLLFKKETHASQWEHDYRKGGRWVVTLRDMKEIDCDDAWQAAMLSLLGESFEDVCGEEIVSGAAVSVHNGSCTLELWLGEYADDDMVLSIGKHFQSMMAETPGLWEKASSRMTFEDFAKNKVVVSLAGARATKSTAGIFQ